MRYFEILNEGRSESISKEEAFNILKTRCREALNATPIFRGTLKPLDFGFVEPQKFTRKSAYTFNWHTLLIDNLDSWANYPKRSKSIVCTTDKTKALRYGYVHRVLPINGSKIGICSSEDWWVSFSKLEQFGRNVNNFNEELKWSFNRILGDEPEEDNWEMLKDWIAILDERLDENPELIREIPSYLTDRGNLPPTEAIPELLEPEPNGFTLTTINNFNTSTNVEVWTDGPSLIIYNKIYEDFIDEFQSISN